jgi:hypothetical protein
MVRALAMEGHQEGFFSLQGNFGMLKEKPFIGQPYTFSQ